jgi:hypothetical protein
MRKLGWIVLVVSMGCGDSTGPISPSEAEDGCRATCERQISCDPLTTRTVAECTADCVGDVAGGGVREDAFNDVVDCITELSCTAEEDVCLTQCEPTDAHEDYEARCRVKLAECGVTDVRGCETTPDGNESGFLCLYTPEVMDELRGCFDQSCGELQSCFERVSTKYALDN